MERNESQAQILLDYQEAMQWLTLKAAIAIERQRKLERCGPSLPCPAPAEPAEDV